MRPPALLLAIAWLLNPVGAWAGVLDDISHRDKLYDVSATGDHVFCVGYPGLLLHSADRGTSWELLDPGTDDALFAIDFDSKGNGAIVGRSGLVLVSSDGGKTWSRSKTDAKAHLFGVSVIDGGLIWAVGHFGTIIHSADGGKTWQEQAYDSSCPRPPRGRTRP